MKALTLVDALEVLTSRAGSKYARNCIKELEEDSSKVGKDKPRLAKLHLHARHYTSGRLVVECLRAYAEKDLSSVYEWAQELAPDQFPEVTEEKAARARRRAADIYADCYLTLAEWVALWNRRQIKAVA